MDNDEMPVEGVEETEVEETEEVPMGEASEMPEEATATEEVAEETPAEE